MSNYAERGSFDVRYYQWLIEKIGANRPPYLDYLMLLQTLHKRDFIWLPSVPMDVNRLMDGHQMRLNYAVEHDYILPVNEDGDFPGVSVLEVLVALALRIDSDIMGEPGFSYPEKWFWTMIENLGLMEFTDDRFDAASVNMILDRFLERKYKKNGSGGLWPLKNPYFDQRKSEIWQQMQDYLNENYSY